MILDEIHAVAASKRGTHLLTAVDRLIPLSGEFQRIALSATVKPLESIAGFIGGYRMEGSGEEVVCHKRPVTIVESGETKRYDIAVRFMETSGAHLKDPYWHALVPELKDIIRRNRSTLLFTNNRRLCEQLSWMLNRDEETPLAYSHHGSLSREMRSVVEARLKQGELPAIVSTSSLELGIDIGALDEVIPDPDASLGVGRAAAHRPGGAQRGSSKPRDSIPNSRTGLSRCRRDGPRRARPGYRGNRAPSKNRWISWRRSSPP